MDEIKFKSKAQWSGDLTRALGSALVLLSTPLESLHKDEVGEVIDEGIAKANYAFDLAWAFMPKDVSISEKAAARNAVDRVRDLIL